MSTVHFFSLKSRCLTASLFATLAVSAAAAQTETSLGPEIVAAQPPAQKQFVWSDLPSWLTLSMEWRGRPESFTGFDLDPNKNRMFVLTRVRGSFDARPLSWLEVYAQFHDLHAPGLPARDTFPSMRDTFDLRQGYINLHYNTRVQLFAGRQMLKFGDERVVGISDWTNASRTWDGFDLRLDYPHWKVDMFSTSVVQIRPTSLDTHGAGLTFHGAWGNLINLVPHTSFMPFVIVRTNPRVLSQQGTYGSETEATFGTEWSATLLHRFDTSGLADLQRGSYSNDSIHSGATIVRGGYALPFEFQPHLEAEYDYASGNPHTNPYRVGTYDQQYPSDHNAFGLNDLFSFQNIKQRRISASFNAPKHYTVLLQGESLHLASPMDGLLAGANGVSITAPAGGFAHDDIGTNIDASLMHTFHDGLQINVGESHFFPGYVMTHSGKGAPSTYVFAQFTYSFGIRHAPKSAGQN